jgi:hypothetical protein
LALPRRARASPSISSAWSAYLRANVLRPAHSRASRLRWASLRRGRSSFWLVELRVPINHPRRRELDHRSRAFCGHADQAVAEAMERGVVADAAGTQLVVVGAGAG